MKYDITGDDSAASATPFSISEMTYGCAPGVTHTQIEERNKIGPVLIERAKKNLKQCVFELVLCSFKFYRLC